MADDPSSKRFSAGRARVAAGIRSGRARVERARSTSPSVAVAFDAFAHDGETGGIVLAAALGFRAFLFQIPYVAFLLIGAGYVADLFDKTPGELLHAGGIGGLTAQGMSNAEKLSGLARFSALFIAAYALLLSARSFVKVIRIVHTLVWRVPPVKMPHATRATLGFLTITTFSVALSIGIDALRQHFLIGAILGLALYTFVPFFLWLCVSWWLPRRDCQIWALVPGATLFAAGVQALHIATVVWFPHEMQSKSQIYGAFGIALVLLLWAYLLGRVITFSAVLNVALWNRREQASPGSSLRPLRLPFIDDRAGLILERFFPPRR